MFFQETRTVLSYILWTSYQNFWYKFINHYKSVQNTETRRLAMIFQYWTVVNLVDFTFMLKSRADNKLWHRKLRTEEWCKKFHFICRPWKTQTMATHLSWLPPHFRIPQSTRLEETSQKAFWTVYETNVITNQKVIFCRPFSHIQTRFFKCNVFVL